MQIFGDSCAFIFQGALLLQALETAVKLPFLRNMDSDNDTARGADDSQSDKPPCLPKMARNHQAQARLALTPNAIVVARCDVKSITARRQITIKGTSPCSCLHPVGLQAFESVAEANQLG